MLINLSNHPSNKWQEKQKSLAIKEYGEIYDMDFPAISPEFDKPQIQKIANKLLNEIIFIFDAKKTKLTNRTVHIQGEFTVVFNLVTLLKNSDIKCIASTSKRDVNEQGNKRILIFNFIKFREY